MTEVIIRTTRLNAHRDATSDYWQARPKIPENLPEGAGTVFVDEVEQDSSPEVPVQSA